MAEEQRRINLHGTVNHNVEHKSYRVEATPISNIFGEIFVLWCFMQITSYLHFGEFKPFSNIWPWYAVLGVIGYHVYKWVQFKLEKR